MYRNILCFCVSVLLFSVNVSVQIDCNFFIKKKSQVAEWPSWIKIEHHQQTSDETWSYVKVLAKESKRRAEMSRRPPPPPRFWTDVLDFLSSENHWQKPQIWTGITDLRGYAWSLQQKKRRLKSIWPQILSSPIPTPF